MGVWLCALSVSLCLCGCSGERCSIPVDHEVVEGAVEEGTEAFIEDPFHLAQTVPPRRVEHGAAATGGA